MPRGSSSSRKRPSPGSEHTSAFALLMGEKRPNLAKETSGSLLHCSDSASRFVICPVGCGLHVSEATINEHLDQCMGEIKSTAENEFKVPQTISQKPLTTISDVEGKESKKMKPEQSLASNAFAHMMHQSQRVFSNDDHFPIRQSFHLHSDGRVSWNEMEPNSSSITDGGDALNQQSHCTKKGIGWSSSVILRGARMLVSGNDRSGAPKDLELTVSTSFSNANDLSPGLSNKHRLVRKHSRLSVPVLKSILQKSIRRRRPLPSVRVAMELIDKSMRDLLRRLPIVVLEDSTLHPDFPLLVWLMVADSKGFVVPPQILTRILQIIYEIASCPYTDCGIDPVHFAGKTHSVSSAAEIPLRSICLSSSSECFEEEFGSTSPMCELTVRAMLLRAQYGGMACDIKMLHHYVDLWRKRFLIRNVPFDLAQKLSRSGTNTLAGTGCGDNTMTNEFRWWGVSEMIHDVAKKQSKKHIKSDYMIDMLGLQDLTIAGVDFHCSAVLETIISDKMLFRTCSEELQSSPEDDVEYPVGGGNSRRTWVISILKECMWKFSSSINHRRPLTIDAESSKLSSLASRKDTFLKNFWDEIVSPVARDFMTAYVRERLSR